MLRFNLEQMVKGWFVGDFEPTIIKTQDVEVAVKKYKAGDHESMHHHKIATELTVIIQGRVIMNGVEYSDNDIIQINPGESTDFCALTDDTITVCVKYPGAKNDKYVD